MNIIIWGLRPWTAGFFWFWGYGNCLQQFFREKQ